MEKELIALAKSLAERNPLLAYLFFFINAALQILFPPYPGDTVIVLQGYFSSRQLLNTPLMFLTTLSATYLSSLIMYLLSYQFGEKVVANKYVSRFFDTEKIEKLNGWFIKYGSAAIIINKFLPGFGSLTLIAAGIFKLPQLPAFISIGVASLLHNAALFMAGRLTGENMDLIHQVFGEYKKLILSGILMIVGIYMYLMFIYKRKHE
jgi:membrane protein DedA with SNARE-associated domain